MFGPLQAGTCHFQQFLVAHLSDVCTSSGQNLPFPTVSVVTSEQYLGLCRLELAISSSFWWHI
jgi:hypothetical protein